MDGKKVMIILGAGFTVLCAVFLFLYSNRDMQGPQIRFPEGEPVYAGKEEDLIEGVRAVDKRDGDVTDTLMIDSIVYSQDKTTVRVAYVARDKSGNIGGATRAVRCAEGQWEREQEEKEPERTQEPLASATVSPEPTAEPTAAPTADPAVPVMKLVSDEVTIAAEENYYITEFVESITDDRDNPDDLYYAIDVFGEYDLTTPGVYEVEFVVTDSDGNQSLPVPLRITVT